MSAPFVLLANLRILFAYRMLQRAPPAVTLLVSYAAKARRSRLKGLGAAITWPVHNSPLLSDLATPAPDAPLFVHKYADVAPTRLISFSKKGGDLAKKTIIKALDDPEI